MGQARLLPPPAMLQRLWMSSLALSPLPARGCPPLALALLLLALPPPARDEPLQARELAQFLSLLPLLLRLLLSRLLLPRLLLSRLLLSRLLLALPPPARG